MIDIPMVPVHSSNVESLSYDAATKTLAVKFKSGGHYHYHDVSQQIYDDAYAAPSTGKYLRNHVSGKFRFTSFGQAGNHVVRK